MNVFFQKHETAASLLLIAVYLGVSSFCQSAYGLFDGRTAAIHSVLSLSLLLLIFALRSSEHYGLTRPKNAKAALYFLPLIPIVSVNLWGGVTSTHHLFPTVCFLCTMLHVGFIEEIVFRGFLFRMLEKDGVKPAMIISSLSFGFGHILNLINGADVFDTLLQICYATAIGFLFSVIFYKTRSLVPCIFAHGLTNALSLFQVENETVHILGSIFLILFPTLYAIYLWKKAEE